MKNILNLLCVGLFAIVLFSLCSCEDEENFPLITGCEDFAVVIEGMEFDSLLVAVTTGGTEPFVYSWSTGETSETANLIFDEISVTVTDSEGCTTIATIDFSIEQDPCENFGALITSDSTNTMIEAQPISGSGTYTYQWDDGSTNSSIAIDPNNGGTFTVTITDSNGCTAIASYEVTSNDPCFGFDATITSDSSTFVLNAIAVSGTGPYSYLWSTGSNSNSIVIDPNIGGVFSVTVIDANGCTVTASYEVPSSDPCFNFNTTINVFPDSTGLIVLSTNTSGGTMPYAYLWSEGSTTSDITTTATEGTFSVSVSDANGCTVFESIEL